MEFSNEFWIQIIIYVAGFGAVWGQITTRIKYLEQKVDKHNNAIERVYKLEESSKSAHHRIDGMEGRENR